MELRFWPRPVDLSLLVRDPRESGARRYTDRGSKELSERDEATLRDLTSRFLDRLARAHALLDTYESGLNELDAIESMHGVPVWRNRVSAEAPLTCYLCGGIVDPFGDVGHPMFGPMRPTVEHVVPRSAGGDDHTGNLEIAHQICNTRKGVRSLQSLNLPFPHPAGYDEELIRGGLSTAVRYQQILIQTRAERHASHASWPADGLAPLTRFAAKKSGSDRIRERLDVFSGDFVRGWWLDFLDAGEALLQDGLIRLTGLDDRYLGSHRVTCHPAPTNLPASPVPGRLHGGGDFTIPVLSLDGRHRRGINSIIAEVYEPPKGRHRVDVDATLMPERANPYDKDAIEVWWGQRSIGYVPRTSQEGVVQACQDAGVDLSSGVSVAARLRWTGVYGEVTVRLDLPNSSSS